MDVQRTSSRFLFSSSPLLPFSPSPLLPFSPSPLLPFSPSPLLLFSSSPLLLFSSSLLLSAKSTTRNCYNAVFFFNTKSKKMPLPFLSYLMHQRLDKTIVLGKLSIYITLQKIKYINISDSSLKPVKFYKKIKGVT